MKHFITLTAIIFTIHFSFAQTNPTPWDLKNSNYAYSNYGVNTSSTTFPSSINFWSGPYELGQAVAPTDNAQTGDEPICVSCPAGSSALINAGFNGLKFNRDAAAPFLGNAYAMVFGLNTLNCYGVRVTWFAALTDHGSDFNGATIQMQYRIGSTGDWTNITGNSFISNFTESIADGHQSFAALLPGDADNEPLVQIRWIYYNTQMVLYTDGNTYAISKVWATSDSIVGVSSSSEYVKAMGNVDCTMPDNLYGMPVDPLFINTALMVNGPLNNTNSGCALDSGYSDYTNTVVDVEAGLSYAMDVRTGPERVANRKYMTVWADWNQDKDFDDPGEEIKLTASQYFTNFYGDISVPVSAKNGLTRMRIRTTRIETPVAYGPTPDGEVEDYTLNVINPADLTPTCAELVAPIDVDSDLCTGSQEFTWEVADGSPDGYTFSLGSDNPPTNVFDNKDVQTDTFFVNTTALMPNTTYYWSVNTYNVFGESSGCDVFSFTTATNVDPSIDNILIDGVDVDSVATCPNTNVGIAATINGGTGTLIYGWTGDDMYLDDNSIRTPIFNSTQEAITHKLRLTVYDDNLCVARDSIKIYVKENPTPGTLSADKTDVCPGEDVNFTLTGYTDDIQDWFVSVNGGAYSGINHTGDTYQKTINDEQAFKVVVAKDGCELETNEVNITLKDVPSVPTITASPSHIACEGETITLTSSSATGNEWNDTNSSTTSSISVTENGVFNVTLIHPTSGCKATSLDQEVTFNELPEPQINVSGLLCDGETVTLSTQYSGNVVWNYGNTTVEEDQIDVTISENYLVSITDPATGCTGTADVTITFNAKPASPTIIQQGDSLITSPTMIVDWYDVDGNVVSTGESFKPERNPDQVFTAVFTDGNGCSSDASDELAYDHTVSVREFEQVNYSIYPNPIQNILFINLKSNALINKVSIKDMTGRVVKRIDLTTGINQIDVSEFTSGVYMLQDNLGNSFKVIKH